MEKRYSIHTHSLTSKANHLQSEEKTYKQSITKNRNWYFVMSFASKLRDREREREAAVKYAKWIENLMYSIAVCLTFKFNGMEVASKLNEIYKSK